MSFFVVSILQCFTLIVQKYYFSPPNFDHKIVFIYHLLVVCLETVETRGSVDRRTRFNRKGKNGQRPRAGKKKANRKFSMRKKMPSKPTLGKKQTGSDTQISVGVKY